MQTAGCDAATEHALDSGATADARDECGARSAAPLGMPRGIASPLAVVVLGRQLSRRFGAVFKNMPMRAFFFLIVHAPVTQARRCRI
jgi:hypothetical protein